MLGEAAAAAAKTDTFLGERYRRLVNVAASSRPGRRRPLHPGDRLAPARRPTARYHDLGSDFYASRIDTDRKTRTHIRQLQALGFTVTLTPAA